MILANKSITMEMATADSGSEENIISLSTITACGLAFDTDPRHWKEFQMGNGNIVRAIGRTSLVNFRFARESVESRHTEHRCIFYVFRRLIAPLLMGMAFLQQTETLTKNRHRLMQRDEAGRTILQVCSLNSPKRRLLCFVNAEQIYANADTGAEMNLISMDYALRRQLHIAPIVDDLEQFVQFADGSSERVSGKVVMEVSFGASSYNFHSVEIFVLDTLHCDIILGAELLEEVDAFRTYERDLEIQNGDVIAPELCPVVWLNSLEQMISRNKQGKRIGKYWPFLGSQEFSV